MSVTREAYITSLTNNIRAAVTNTGTLSAAEITTMFNVVITLNKTTDPSKPVKIKQSLTSMVYED